MTRLSVFASAYATAPSGETSLAHFIEQVRTGVYSKPIAAVREGKKDKRELPAVTFSGAFSVRNSAGLILHSGLLQIDIDEKDNPGTDMVTLQAAVGIDPFVAATFISAGGRGLKVILAIDGARHAESAAAAVGYFDALYGVKIDRACKDIPRLCFVSDDPGATLSTSDIRVFKAAESTEVDGSSSAPSAAVASPPAGAKVFEYTSPEHEAAAISRVEEVLSFIPSRPDYPDWLRILSGVFDELPYHHAVVVLNDWSPEESENEYEKKYGARLKEVGFGSVIKMAIENGFDNSAEKKAERAVSKLPDLAAADGADISPEPGDGEEGGGEEGGGEEGGGEEGGGEEGGGEEGGPGGTGGPAAAAAPKAKILVHLDEVNDAKCAPEFVKNLLSVGGLSVLYGPGNVGKSFWWQDLAAHVARGMKWRNGEVIIKGGPVIYFALEGAFGVRKRILAMKKRGILTGDDIPLDLCFMPIRLLEDGKGRGAVVISDAIKEAEDYWQQAVRWVVLDTLARTMAGGDENATKDMGKVISECDKVRNKHLGTAIGAIHHSGKDADRGMRGNTSLYDGVDTVIEMYRPPGEGDIITATVRKQRELDFREPMPFRLDPVELGTDDEGDPITSCVCIHLRSEEGTVRGSASARGGGSGGSSGRKARVPVHQILGLLPQPSKERWKREAEAKFGVSKTSFYRSLDEIKGQDRYEVQADGGVILVGDIFGFGGENGGKNEGNS